MRYNCFTADMLRQVLSELYEVDAEDGPSDLTLIFNLPQHHQPGITEALDELDDVVGSYIDRGLCAIRFLEKGASLADNATYRDSIAARVPLLKARGVVRFWCVGLAVRGCACVCYGSHNCFAADMSCMERRDTNGIILLVLRVRAMRLNHILDLALTEAYFLDAFTYL